MKVYSQNNTKLTTIDGKHTEMMETFHIIQTETIPQLQSEILLLEERKKKKTIDEIMEYNDKIKENQEKIRNLRSKKKAYLLNNSKYIFQYFEQKKDISSGTVTTMTCSIQNRDKINSFFKIKSANSTNQEIRSDSYTKSKKFYQNYWRNVNNDISNIKDFIHPTDICETCNRGELIPHDEEGILVCNNNQCGVFIIYIVDSSKPSNKEPPNEVSYTAYIRLNHFKEILSQFQAKETTQIPDEIIEAIRARIKKERITDISTINYDKMRDILRKLGLNKYFEHIQYINSIFGVSPPIMSEELHETLCVLFIEIQKPWALHCPSNRTNFFNYAYCLHQLCGLLDQHQYLPFIPSLKDAQKRREADIVWKKVCNELNWEYIASC
jgi:hypothetical protein